MKLECGLESVRRNPSSIVTVGSFDGVHAGHQAVLSYVIGRARAQRACSTLVTFEPHPRQVLTGRDMPLLTTVREKARLLEAMGLDRLIVLAFTREFASISPEDYVSDILVSRVGLQEVIVGHDHGFGRGRKGDVRLLRKMGSALGFVVGGLPAALVGSRVAASQTIRELLVSEGDAAGAHAMLTRPYAITACVVKGAGRGRTIGVPTANLEVLSTRKVIPLRGVYAVQAAVRGGVYDGMMNIGYRPTVDSGGRQHLEVHLFDFERNIYGETITVFFLHRLRDEQQFTSVEALKAQLRQDARRSRALLRRMEPVAGTAVLPG